MKIFFAAILSMISSYSFAAIPALWSAFAGVRNPGGQGIVAADINGDGAVEAVIAAPRQDTSGDTNLLVLRKRNSIFAVSSISLQTGPLFGRIQKIALPGGRDGIALSAGGRLVTWSGEPLVQVASVPVLSTFGLLQISDVDADGQLEAFGRFGGANSSGRPVVLDYETGVEEWSGSELVQFLGAGQLDEDPQLEIVLGNTSPVIGRVIDGLSHQAQASRVEGFLGWPVFGNFFGSVTDKEFAIIPPFGSMNVFSGAPNFALSTAILTSEAISFDVKDVDNDQFDDLIVGDAQRSQIEAFSTVSNRSIFRWPHLGRDTSALAAGRFGDSANLEIVFGAGLSTSGADSLQVIDAATGAQRFYSANETGPTTNLVVWDSGSGKELAFLTHVSGRTLELVVLNAHSGTELRRRVLPDSDFPQTGWVQATDIENDGNKELVVGFGRTIALLDGLSLLERWQAAINETIRRIDLIKFNGDSVDDIVVSTEFRFYILDGRNGSELYRSVSFQLGSTPKVAIGQADADLQLEVVISNGRNVFVVDPTRGLVEMSFQADQSFMDLRIENAPSCLVILMQPDRLERRSCATGSLISTRMLPNALTSFVDYLDSSADDLIVAFGNRVHRVRGSEVIASSDVLGPDLLSIGRLQPSGASTAVYIAGGGVHRVDMPIELPMFSNGFE